MRIATLAVNLGFLITSFAIGVFSGRQHSAAATTERLPVAGSAAEATAQTDSSELAGSGAAAADQPSPAWAPGTAGQLGPHPRRAAASKGRSEAHATPQEPAPLPTWSQVAASAQGWTAAVRADQNYGAGVIIDHSGLMLTNLHVVEGARAVSVTPFGAEAGPAEVLDTDAELDIALLEFSRPTTNAAPLGSALSLGVGDEVLAVGSPRKMYFSVSRGMVSFPNRFLDGVEYIQTDLPINVGNSGGPLVDREGRLIGIVSFILRDSQGISFALPIDRALTRFAKHLQAKSSRNRATAAVAKPSIKTPE
jgi:S1-C subfamily serine protease